jgi:hypothetical protein
MYCGVIFRKDLTEHDPGMVKPNAGSRILTSSKHFKAYSFISELSPHAFNSCSHPYQLLRARDSVYRVEPPPPQHFPPMVTSSNAILGNGCP